MSSRCMSDPVRAIAFFGFRGSSQYKVVGKIKSILLSIHLKDHFIGCGIFDKRLITLK